jgi:hypothetical protein
VSRKIIARNSFGGFCSTVIGGFLLQDDKIGCFDLFFKEKKLYLDSIKN